MHGYRQNATAFKDKTGSLRKLLKKHAEFVYISAPHLIPATVIPSNETVSSLEEQRSWYFSTEKLTFNSHDVTEHCSGLEKSIETVSAAFEELGPFDGILGFSQGAAFTALLCALLKKGGLFQPIKNTFLPICKNIKLWYHNTYSTQSIILHLFQNCPSISNLSFWFRDFNLN